MTFPDDLTSMPHPEPDLVEMDPELAMDTISLPGGPIEVPQFQQSNDLVVFPELTSRERQVALGLATGLNNHMLAHGMGISVKTVGTHRMHVLKKLQLPNNVMLALYAVRQGWVRP